MEQSTRLAKLKAPLGGQELELHQVQYAGGGMALLRVRIREGRRFTVFDIDPDTAQQWGEAMATWARAQQQGDSSLCGEAGW